MFIKLLNIIFNHQMEKPKYKLEILKVLIAGSRQVPNFLLSFE